MPVDVTRLAPYEDDAGNVVQFDGDPVEKGIRVRFTGSNNRLVVSAPVRIAGLIVDFDCDNGLVEIARSNGAFSAAIRVGQDASVHIGANVSSTSSVAMSAVEGTTIRIGDDVMFASENQVRCDDGHPIFDVRSGRRVNVSRDITVGAHVWAGRFATLLGGARVGEGTVLGYGSIVTGTIPNNCIAVGSPARVVRRDIAWERPHLSLVKPYYKPDVSTVRRSRYWRLTDDDTPRSRARLAAARLRRAAGRAVRRVRS